ncbi:helix-turn-helix domain-containing protein [Enterococcus faecalis]
MFLSLKTLYRKRTVIWPFYFYTIIRTLSYITKLCLKNGFNEVGQFITYVDEYMLRQLEIKLIEAILKFKVN